MAKLVSNSNGSLGRSPGESAVVMLRSGVLDTDGNRAFDFRESMLSDITRIMWPDVINGAPSALAIVPDAMAQLLISRRYARSATEADAAQWNAAVDAVEALNKAAVQTDLPDGATDATKTENDVPAAKSEAVATPPVAATTSAPSAPRAPTVRKPKR